MTDKPEDKPSSIQTGRAALANIRRMLDGKVPFPKDEAAATEMVKAAEPIEAAPLEDLPFHGTAEEVVAGFESAAQRSAEGVEFWSARDLMALLGYGKWQNFQAVIEKAQMACHQSGYRISDHFAEVSKMVEIGSGAERSAGDTHVTRYGAYLIAQSGDTRKKQVAFAQTYFAVQTRRQEAQGSDRQQLSEDQKRIDLRERIAAHNKDLASAARIAGVGLPVEFAAFQNHGYRGLYGGLDVNRIRETKGLAGKAQILDHMGSTELAANLFRATQAEEKLRREGIKGRENANAAHFEVGQKVRKAIADIGGTMPERLETAEDIDKVRRRLAQGEPPTSIV
jgi:DNA-damage-inducible protein D